MISELTWVTEMAEQLDSMSSVKLNGFRAQFKAPCESSQTEVLRDNETIYL